MRISSLDSFTADQGDDRAWESLRRLGEVSAHARSRSDEVVARCAGAHAVLTNKVAIGAEVMAALPELRYIGVMATGTNIVDLKAAAERSIVVTNVPGYSTESVAQLVFALALHLLMDVAGHDAAAKAGRWSAGPDFCFFLKPLVELSGKTLVVVGMGAIGSAVGRIGSAFGMRVVSAQVPGSSSANRMPLDEALALADIVTLHCPLTPATKGLVGATFLAALKPGAIVINTGRGPLVDEDALADALASGRLGGAGLDVLAQEPPASGHRLLDGRAPGAGRLVVTPHIGWGTVEARQRLTAQVAANLAAFGAGQPINRVA